MPWLKIKNRTKDWIVFDSVVGLVPADGTRTLFVRVADVEALRSSLVSLQEQQLITFDVFNTADVADDDAEYVTLADIKHLIAESSGSGSGASSSGVFILRPGATNVWPDSIVFSTWSSLYERLAVCGGGIVIVDDSLRPGMPIHFTAGSYDLSGVFIQGFGTSQPTVVLASDFHILGNTLRIQNINLLCDTSSNLVEVSSSTNGLVHLIHSKVTMLADGHLMAKLSGSTGVAELVLESSVVASSEDSGCALYVESGEVANLSVTRCSVVLQNSLGGSGDVDAVRDINSVVTKYQTQLIGRLVVSLCTASSRKYGVPLVGTKNSYNRVFFVPESYVHDASLGETIVVHHNGRRLRQAQSASPVDGGEYYPLESNGPGTGYDSIYLLSFSPNTFSELDADYMLA
jgi:hypothetical protein